MLICRVVCGEVLRMTAGGEDSVSMIAAAVNSKLYDGILGDRKVIARQQLTHLENCGVPSGSDLSIVPCHLHTCCVKRQRWQRRLLQVLWQRWASYHHAQWFGRCS